MDLHGAVGGLAAQAVCPVVAHRDLVGERVLDLLPAVSWSISHAVLRISSRSISACVASSTSGHWIAWFSASALPNGFRSRAYLTLSLMQ